MPALPAAPKGHNAMAAPVMERFASASAIVT